MKPTAEARRPLASRSSGWAQFLASWTQAAAAMKVGHPALHQLLVPLGYAAGYPWLGWLTALFAVLTACLRVLGGALGQRQDFGRVLPKQRRMAVLTIALLAEAIEASLLGSRLSLLAAAIVIAAGSLVTCVSRTIGVAQRLEAR